MRREPPADVRRKLRREIGFGCPVIGCGSPYLYWHHFDPPWRVLEHHNHEGMIALCGQHHSMADAGAFTLEQLREFKEKGAARAEKVKGKFEWMRHDLLVVAGGNFNYQTPTVLEYRGLPRIWFNRDEEGYLLLNIRGLGSQEKWIEDNFWVKQGNPEDLESPPSGRLLKLKYPNGDLLRVEFRVLKSSAEAMKRYSALGSHLGTGSAFGELLPFPVTAVEVHLTSAEHDIKLGPQGIDVRGQSAIGGNFLIGVQIAIGID